MIDFHCHLDLYPDALKLLPIVSARNLFTLVVTTSPKAWLATSNVFAGYENIKVALGLHPEIAEQKAGERLLLLSCIPKAKYIGEIGIDGSPKYKETISLQESILNDALTECEQAGGKILSIHSRNASSRVLDLVEKNCRKSTVVLHWFSGSLTEAQRAQDLGCWFSVGPAMLRGANGRSIVASLPINKILPETDGPFTTNRSAPLMPWEAIDIVNTLVPIWGIPKEDVILQIRNNLAALISEENFQQNHSDTK